jgi:hypothetical protein
MGLFDLWKRLRDRANANRRGRDVSISLDNTGFDVLRQDHIVARVEWEQVHEINAFKVDCFIYDTICVAFTLLDDRVCEITEEIEGFDAIAGEIEQRYGVSKESWWSKVAFPAFETNLTCLWSRTATQPEAS